MFLFFLTSVLFTLVTATEKCVDCNYDLPPMIDLSIENPYNPEWNEYRNLYIIADNTLQKGSFPAIEDWGEKTKILNYLRPIRCLGCMVQRKGRFDFKTEIQISCRSNIPNIHNWGIRGSYSRKTANNEYLFTTVEGRNHLVLPDNTILNGISEALTKPFNPPIQSSLLKMVGAWTLADNATLPDLFLNKMITYNSDDVYYISSIYNDMEENLPDLAVKVAAQIKEKTGQEIVFEYMNQEADFCHVKPNGWTQEVPLKWGRKYHNLSHGGNENKVWIPSVLGPRTKIAKPTPPTPPNLPPLRTPKRKNYTSLEDELRKYLNDHPKLIPKYVQMSFHDIMNYDKTTGTGAAQGCIFDERVLAFPLNQGMRKPAESLQNLVAKKFPNITFPSGDIVSLMGKVAIEKAYPCIKIAWEFGRKSCIDVEHQSGPTNLIFTLNELRPFTERYGLTPTEMAILTSGAHGIANASNHEENFLIPSFRFGNTTSGVEFIRVTANSVWDFFFESRVETGPKRDGLRIGRFPTDMMFFPTTLKKIASQKGVEGVRVDSSAETARIEKTLLALNETTFNARFGQVYAKMLRVGTSNLKWYSSGSSNSSSSTCS